MYDKRVTVLLIQESKSANAILTGHLTEIGCDCCSAASRQDVQSYLDGQRFDLMLSPVQLSGESLYFFLELLDGSHTTLFYYHPVEDGCWWLPALWRGFNCFGAPALRPSEFVSILDATIADIHARRAVTYGSPIRIGQPPPGPPPKASALSATPKNSSLSAAPGNGSRPIPQFTSPAAKKDEQ